LTEVLFLVVGRAKTERVTKEGNRETVFRVSLKSENGKCRLTLADNDSGLLVQYPLGSKVDVDIGKSNQRVLTPEELSEEIRKAEDAEED
jgi:hypothetical protein